VKPKYSLILPAYNTLRYTIECVESLLRTVPKRETEIIFINDGSKDGTKSYAEYLSRSFNFIKVVNHPERVGFTLSVNEGLSLAQGSYLVILNNDLVFPRDWLTGLETALKRAPEVLRVEKVGYCGPKSNFTAGLQQLRLRSPVGPGDVERVSNLLRRKVRGLVTPSLFIGGWCMFIDRDMYEDIGGMDEDMNPGGYDDDGICLKAYLKGYLGVVAEDVFVFHYGQRSTSQPELRWMQGGLHNRWKFYKKYQMPWDKPAKIVGMLRVKNGEEFIERCLSSMSRVVDKICVLNDHSTDRTKQIAEKFEKVVRIFDSPFDTFDEARDRDLLLQMAKEELGDHENGWLFMLDVDEEIEESVAREDFERLCHPVIPKVMGWVFREWNFWRGDQCVRLDGLWGDQAFPRSNYQSSQG